MKLHIITGPAGVGKSTYGRKLAAELGACFLDSDTVTEPVVRAGMARAGLDPDDRDSQDYRVVFREAVYECLYAVVAENIGQVEVVMVGPFTSEIRREEWPAELAKRFGAEVRVIFVSCPDEVRRERIIGRENPRDELKLRDWEAYLAGCDTRAPVFPYESVRT